MRSPNRTEPQRPAARRPYRMRRRAEHVDATRRRITEAAVRLHTGVGPSQASIAAIAEEAGVTRLTVYRHFPERDMLFAACMDHWEARHPGPDPGVWAMIADPMARARFGLGELYAWYAAVGHDLAPIHRDLEHLPPSARARMAAEDARLADALAGDAARGDVPRTQGAKRIRAVAAHLVRLETWRSLVEDQGLATAEAVDAGVAWLDAMSSSAADEG